MHQIFCEEDHSMQHVSLNQRSFVDQAAKSLAKSHLLDGIVRYGSSDPEMTTEERSYRESLLTHELVKFLTLITSAYTRHDDECSQVDWLYHQAALRERAQRKSDSRQDAHR